MTRIVARMFRGVQCFTKSNDESFRTAIKRAAALNRVPDTRAVFSRGGGGSRTEESAPPKFPEAAGRATLLKHLFASLHPSILRTRPRAESLSAQLTQIC